MGRMIRWGERRESEERKVVGKEKKRGGDVGRKMWMERER